MRSYQIVVLLALLVVLGSIVGYRVGYGIGEHRGATQAVARLGLGAGCDCGLPPEQMSGAAHAAAPKIPTGSGRPCLVEFENAENDECIRMREVLEELAPTVSGQLDIVKMDTAAHLAEVQRWRLRMIPTQVLVGPDGDELWRHEGFISLQDLQAAIGEHVAPPSDSPDTSAE